MPLIDMKLSLEIKLSRDRSSLPDSALSSFELIAESLAVPLEKLLPDPLLLAVLAPAFGYF
jgi:hypothetical protein